MGTTCASRVDGLFLFCYEREFMMSFSENNQSDVIEACNSTSRYLDDLLKIDNNFFDCMANRIYSADLQFNKVNVSDPEASFWIYINLYRMVLLRLKFMINEMILILCISFLYGDVPRSTSYEVYISQFIRFARVSSHVDDFNTRNKVLPAKTSQTRI